MKLDDIAGEVPRTGKIESQVMQLRRWLKNKTISVELYYLPFIEMVLSSLAQQPLVLIIDGSSTARGCVTLMVSVVYKKRSLPLLWVTRKGKKGHFPEALHIELITAVKAIIPEFAEVICLGDGEFDGSQWLDTLTGFGWKYVCRTAKTTVFYEEGDRFSFQDICPERGGLSEIAEVEFTDQRQIKVNAVVYWSKKYQDPLYLVTNVETGDEAYHWYRKRFNIETLFSDLKSRGFNFHKSGLRDAERVSRLLIAAALAYLWMVYLGALAMQKGWHKIIHRTNRCDISLFQLGKRWFRYVLRQGMPLPDFRLILPLKSVR